MSSNTTDEAFYDNLTIGLMKVLGNVPRVTNITLNKRQPTERSQISTWEQRHNVYLSDDMKRFYLSTDGFTLSWSYQYSPNDIRRVGHCQIPQLLKIILLRENLETLTNSNPSTSSSTTPIITTATTSASSGVEGNAPILNSRTKIFELSNICGMAKVCLVYEGSDMSNPKIYLLELNNYKWQFLADTFTEYLRMTFVHLALPYWELCFSSCGLPSWTEQLFLLMAPHLLEKTEPMCKVIPNEQDIPPYNTLDPTVFRSKPRLSRQNQKEKGR